MEKYTVKRTCIGVLVKVIEYFNGFPIVWLDFKNTYNIYTQTRGSQTFSHQPMGFINILHNFCQHFTYV